MSIEEFYREVRAAQTETEDPYLLVFIDCLLASADYDSFYKVMAKEGRKLSLARRAAASSVPDAKADAKPEKESKGGGSVDFAEGKKSSGEGKSEK